MRLDELPPPPEGVIDVVVGPTASGKTELALRLCERARGDAEIVSADSVQIYTRFDLGSGKPDAAERARAPHHLIDAVDPLAPMDAGRYAALGEAAFADLRARGKRPIVCGGTFLWVKALVQGLAPSAPRDEAVRARHQALAEREGRAALHAKLRAVDPISAERLAPNDLVRVSRALEVFELTGRPQSAWHDAHGFRAVRHPHRLLAVDLPREALDRRIEARARAWLAQGWVEEVRGLVDAGYGQARAMGSVGFREVHAHLRGELSEEELLPAIVRATRVFVRRQRTWLNGLDIVSVALE